MIKSISIWGTLLALALASTAVLAAKGGSSDRKDVGDLSVPVQSQRSKENLNRNSGDDKLQGLDRAQERMQDAGVQNSKSGDAQTRQKTTKKSKQK